MMRGVLRLWIAFGAIATLALPASAQSQRACPADKDFALLVAASNQIVVGRMTITPEVATRIRGKATAYLDIPVAVSQTIRGPQYSNLSFKVYPNDAPYSPSNAAVLGFGEAPALIFLTRANNQLFFAGDTPAALQPGANAAGAVAEVTRQESLLKNWHADNSLPQYRAVHDLIAQLGTVSGAEQQRVFDRIEALGQQAVPAIVAQMDDRRPLRNRAMALRNHEADAFEGSRYYGPELVVDALSAILNQITGVSFGSIENGASNSDRDAAVAGWRVYAADLSCPD
jgi:hypothetical protein